MSNVINIFGLQVQKVDFSGALQLINTIILEDKFNSMVVVTPNVDHIVKVYNDKCLYDIYKNADYIFADGFPVVLASKILNHKCYLPERVTGADLFPAICSIVEKMNGRIFLIGGHPGSESNLKSLLKNKYPLINFEVFSPSFQFNTDSVEALDAVARINKFKPDVTFVCLGMPKQELWSFRYRKELSTKLICCFGAAYEFDLGLVKRAPYFMQKFCLEWLWRLLLNPRKLFRRYLIDDICFIKILIKEKFK